MKTQRKCFYCAGTGIQVQCEEDLDFHVPDPKDPCIHCDGKGFEEEEEACDNSFNK